MLAIQDWLIDIDTEIPIADRKIYGTLQILTVVENGGYCGVFCDLISKKRGKRIDLYYADDLIGQIPTKIITQYDLLNLNILSVIILAHFDNKTFIEITV